MRVIEAARAAQVPVLVNLGGSPLSDGLRSAAAGYEKLLVQTNVDDSAHAEAFTVARSLLEETAAVWVVVTAGAYGAVAVNPTDTVAAPAFPVTVRHTHCAGAAFSGGLLYGLREGWSMDRSMVLGSARGHCGAHDTTVSHCRRWRSWRPSSLAVASNFGSHATLANPMHIVTALASKARRVTAV
ncbi:PfkB family carbohydrate kinase [Nocardia sp. CA-120079]|uniref:PfkB family carbohydrate kinase n=1 Tax=Nocardia sp. CA-120079 TaxID=3239974 RepID=UPI003D96BE3C